MKLLLVCGPYDSGTSAAAGLLANLGAVGLGPYHRTNDPRTLNRRTPTAIVRYAELIESPLQQTRALADFAGLLCDEPTLQRAANFILSPRSDVGVHEWRASRSPPRPDAAGAPSIARLVAPHGHRQRGNRARRPHHLLPVPLGARGECRLQELKKKTTAMLSFRLLAASLC